jgi:hypothetical protein
MSLLAYCQAAIRMGSSRKLALEVYRAQGNVVSERVFRKHWGDARLLEDLFTPHSGVRRP